jgi:hypothetical protein
MKWLKITVNDEAVAAGALQTILSYALARFHAGSMLAVLDGID